MTSSASTPIPSNSPKDQELDHAEDWKALKLSLERPYKDDRGERLPTLLDIEQDGKFIYETSVLC